MKLSAIGYQLSAVLMLAGSPLAAQTSLSIYRDGRVVVRRMLPQALQQGRNNLTLRLEALDPATLFSPDTVVAVMSATARYPSKSADALASAVGETLSFVSAKGDTIRATVVGVDPPQFKLPDGRLLLGSPGTPLFPASVVRTAPQAQIVLDASRARPRTELAYVAQGVTWEALYQVILAGARCQVSGTATITSQELRADSAEVQLVAGAIRRTRVARPRPQPNAFMDGARMQLRAATSMATATVEEAVGETHVYQLPGRMSIEPNVPITTALFPRSTTPVAQDLIVPGVLPWRGWIGEASEPNRVPVQVWYTINARPRRHSATGRCRPERSSCIRPIPAGAYSSSARPRMTIPPREKTSACSPVRHSTSLRTVYRPTSIRSSYRRRGAACLGVNASPRRIA